jgi:hypothetical protein
MLLFKPAAPTNPASQPIAPTNRAFQPVAPTIMAIVFVNHRCYGCYFKLGWWEWKKALSDVKLSCSPTLSDCDAAHKRLFYCYSCYERPIKQNKRASEQSHQQNAPEKKVCGSARFVKKTSASWSSLTAMSFERSGASKWQRNVWKNVLQRVENV